MLFRIARSFPTTGLIVGLLFFCASLTPSLLPRDHMVQGVLGGIAFAVGYVGGIALTMLWRFLEIKEITGKAATMLSRVALAVLVGVTAWTLRQMAVWQNSVRELMEMEPVDSGYPFTVTAIAIVTALIVIGLTRLVITLCALAARWINRAFPQRLSVFVGSLVVLFILYTSINGLLLRTGIRMMDEVFAAINETQDSGLQEPLIKGIDGTTASLIEWDDIGRNGKLFLTSGPDRAEIEAFTGLPAKQPIRVYAGYNTGETLEERAQIALDELIRTGGFNRKTLIVATPTGTGWLDPSAMSTMPYILHGDVAVVSMQYSYTPSWMTLLVEPDLARESAVALFEKVYTHWTKMPKDNRPELFLFGLSLGALGSEDAVDLISMLADPIDGALWAGPPFASHTWPQVTRTREPGSPAWQPIFRDSSYIRFMTHKGFSVGDDTPWGPLRIVYIQHPSDPMSFFAPSLAFARPEWLLGERGYDVSSYLRWVPIVTFIQIAFDIPMATTVPAGFGHTFGPDDYIRGWISVLNPDNWTAEDTEALMAKFKDFDATPI
ncbi:alpha/beta-hydrolase family protein [Halocynthiibacter sp. C4]|uniref:alpha/beta hydrolase n=1 Tax=Halocynthiibacter sp. C4 TaxID=2992758 RepID=UPI00237A88E0|nr:alpha/beta-hydrolase family protein [Halocynthiibacter sp. C4]MDE0588506.1 alpha/beta-hydrolase family protein [Halocynthiibacter sp. C4]